MLSSRFSQCNLPWNTLWTCKHLLYFEKSKISFKLSIFIACRKLSYNSCLLFRCFHKFLLKNFKTLQSSGLTFVSHSVSSYGILPELSFLRKCLQYCISNESYYKFLFFFATNHNVPQAMFVFGHLLPFFICLFFQSKQTKKCSICFCGPSGLMQFHNYQPTNCTQPSPHFCLV